MKDHENPLTGRSFTVRDARRVGIVMLMFLLLGAGYWLMLPSVQDIFLPTAPGGESGPWIIRPPYPFRFGAAAVLVACSLPLVLGPMKARWLEEDGELGTRYDPFASSPIKRGVFVFQGCVLLLVYAFALVFYLSCYDVIDANGIEHHLPWGAKQYSYGDIQKLTYLPEGKRSDQLNKNGPWYEIRMQSGQCIQLSLDNERLTSEELKSVTRFIDRKTWMSWQPRKDARDR